MELQSVGLREFRAHLHKYTRQGDNPIVITSHGETIGYYIPTNQVPQVQNVAALKDAVIKLSALLEANDVDADTIMAEFQTERQRNRAS